MIKRLRSFNWWNEIFSILLAVFIYLLSPVIIIWLDNFQGKLIFTVFPQIQSMPAIWGISVTQRILFSFVGVLCANAFGWWMLKINHKKIYWWGEIDYFKKFKNVDAYRQCLLYLYWFGIYFIGFILGLFVL